MAVELSIAKINNIDIRIAHSHNTKSDYKIIHKFLSPLFRKNYTVGVACGISAGEWLYGNKQFMVVKNGINLDEFTYDSIIRKRIRDKYNFEGCNVYGHVGHFSFQKNHMYLIETFYEISKQDDKARLVLIGDGTLKGEVVKQTEHYGLSNKVYFLGKIDNVNEWYSSLDVLIMPSRFEGLPLTLVEAQACNLPCFIADTISREVVLTNFVKVLNLASGPESWARSILKSDVFKLDRTCLSGYDSVKNASFDIDNNVDDLYKLYCGNI